MDPQEMDVETAKQASTVEDDGDSDSDDGYIVNNLWFKNVTPEKEPEWDVDSYDGREYKSDPEDSKYFSDEEQYQDYRLRKREMFESKGFIPDLANGIYSVGSLDAPAGEIRTVKDGILQPPSGEYRTTRDGLTHLASLCVKKFNEVKGTCVQLVSIVRATVSGGAERKTYITFMAREYENGPLVEYQAKVMRYVGNYKPPFLILCRPSPRQPTISTLLHRPELTGACEEDQDIFKLGSLVYFHVS